MPEHDEAPDEQFRQWRHRLSQRVGSEVRRHRLSQGTTVTDLAAQTGITRMALTSIEGGTREGLSVAEMLALADALGISPTALLVPAGVAELEVTPGRLVPVDQVVEWLVDPLAAAAWWSRTEDVSTAPGTSPPRRHAEGVRLRRLLSHRQLLARYRAAPEGSAERLNSWNYLRNTRDQMRGAGDVLPDLPPELAAREQQELHELAAPDPLDGMWPPDEVEGPRYG